MCGRFAFFPRGLAPTALSRAGEWLLRVAGDDCGQAAVFHPPLESCKIITTEATAPLDRMHHRAPVILPPTAHAAWLEPREPNLERLRGR